ncbi:NADH-cytochrome b5 reductase-like [Venturia canescens]|uniref:NADH-cytochrome b5 reductase-like n=1 Tax=Venturia canescens TaxID=32260 RepID=UPI001C9BD740|nr:NADH-cytochrome b5 reductase-like [Venturia canescens]
MNDDKNDKNFDETSSRPATPREDDCCGNSCNPCVFDVHKQLLEQYNRRKAQGIENSRRNNFLNPLLYKIFSVKNILVVADNYVKLVLDCSQQIERNSKIILLPGQHIILYAQNKKSRPYTPISWTNDSLELLIKVYVNGELSSYLANAKIADEIRVRGPYGDFVYEKNRFSEIVAFCIGSGIAAIYPIARSVVDEETDETRFHLVAGFRTTAEIPLRIELQQLSDYWNVKCTLQISSPMWDGVSPNGIEIQRGRLNEFTFNELVKNCSTAKTLILICGTPKFNESLERWSRNRNFFHYHVFS